MALSRISNNIPPDDDLVPRQIIPEDRQATAGGQMETRTRVILDGPGQIGRPVVDRIETTGLGEGGMVESVEIRLTHADCGHVMHTGSELGSACADLCGRLLCANCASKPENLCHSCRRPVAGFCQIRPWLAGDGQVFCQRCWRRWWMRELAVAGAIGIGVLALVSFLLRAVF
jgi:hypothetical protein